MQCKNSAQLILGKKKSPLHIFICLVPNFSANPFCLYPLGIFYNLKMCNGESGRWWLSGSQPWGVQNKCGSMFFTLWFWVVQTGQALHSTSLSAASCYIFISLASQLLAKYWEVVGLTGIAEVIRCKCMCFLPTVTGLLSHHLPQRFPSNDAAFESPVLKESAGICNHSLWWPSVLEESGEHGQLLYATLKSLKMGQK